MTYAICIKCGEGKHGAFVPCLKCGFMPESRSDQARSILLSDLNTDIATLDAAGAKLRAGEALAFDEPGIAEMAAELDEIAKHPPDARRRRLRLPTWLTVLLLLVCLPVIIPAFIVLEAVQKRRLRRAARSFTCLNCGKLLGANAVAVADAEWSRYVRELMRQHPGVKLRLVRTVDAICPGCGACYMFRESERTFVMGQNPFAQAGGA
jgi:hypothetical protein